MSYNANNILSKIFGNSTFMMKNPLKEADVIRFWMGLEELERGDSKMTPKKSVVHPKIVTAVFEHFDIIDKKAQKNMETRVLRLIKRAETIRETFGTKRKDVENYIILQKSKFQSAFNSESKQKQKVNEKLTKVSYFFVKKIESRSRMTTFP